MKVSINKKVHHGSFTYDLEHGVSNLLLYWPYHPLALASLLGQNDISVLAENQ